MRAIDYLRAAWTSIRASRGRSAAAVGSIVAALAVGVGFSLAVNEVREAGIGRPLISSSSAVATATASASPDATPTLVSSGTPEALATASAVPTTPEPTVAITPPPTPVATPAPTAIATPRPFPTAPPMTAGCDSITADSDGVVYVNGERVPDDPWEEEYGEQMPMGVMRLAARTAGASGATACLQVDLPAVSVSGSIEICGDVVSERLEPLPTPTPANPGDPLAPRYGEPTISGVRISDRTLSVHSYALLEIADAVDTPACFNVAALSNDVYITLSLAICEPVRLAADGTMIIYVGGDEYSVAPEYVFDEAGALPIGETVDAGLDVRAYHDDVIHLVEMALWASPPCP